MNARLAFGDKLKDLRSKLMLSAKQMSFSISLLSDEESGVRSKIFERPDKFKQVKKHRQ